MKAVIMCAFQFGLRCFFYHSGEFLITFQPVFNFWPKQTTKLQFNFVDLYNLKIRHNQLLNEKKTRNIQLVEVITKSSVNRNRWQQVYSNYPDCLQSLI